jgi:predicted extracellular nuclease
MQDGQGNCNLVRTDAAAALADWLATDPTGSADPDYLIIGDLNSYDEEDPIGKLQSAGFTDMVKQFGGEKAYSYLFDAAVGYLDHALASPVLTQQITDTSVWAINADEPDILDYDTSFKKDAQDALYAPDAFRSSDHDPVIVGLNLYIVPRDKNQCKKDGWKDLRRNDGSEFRNQGLCIRYVNNGK